MLNATPNPFLLNKICYKKINLQLISQNKPSASQNKSIRQSKLTNRPIKIQSANQINQPVKPTNQPVKPTNQPVKPTNQLVKPTNQLVKPTNQPVKPTNQPVKTNQSNKPISHSTNQPIDQSVTPCLQLQPPFYESLRLQVAGALLRPQYAAVGERGRRKRREWCPKAVWAR